VNFLGIAASWPPLAGGGTLNFWPPSRNVTLPPSSSTGSSLRPWHGEQWEDRSRHRARTAAHAVRIDTPSLPLLTPCGEPIGWLGARTDVCGFWNGLLCSGLVGSRLFTWQFRETLMDGSLVLLVGPSAALLI
jgi:hypothetical protein